MLPKIWKKLLLAICIIAILFNITSKLVNRISLEKTILSVPEGIDMKEVLNIVEEEPIVQPSLESTYNVVENQMIETENQEEFFNQEGQIIDLTQQNDFTTLLN